ncbi:MAG: hypothetical protein ACI4E0_11215, partial [Blautia sp.]
FLPRLFYNITQLILSFLHRPLTLDGSFFTNYQYARMQNKYVISPPAKKKTLNCRCSIVMPIPPILCF